MENTNRWIGQITSSHPAYQDALKLRYEVFFRPHGLPKNTAIDKWEPMSRHFVAIVNDELISYGRLTEFEQNLFNISQLVTNPNHQGEGYGTLVLRQIITQALKLGAERISLNARINFVGFYEKQGFISEGEAFPSTRTQIPHIHMVLLPHEST